MLPGISFSAPWGASLKLITGLSILVLLGIPVLGLATGPRGESLRDFGMIALPLLILAGTVFFLIREYTLTPDTLLVRRLGWSSKLDLSGLLSAEADPRAMAKSIRTFGNGGLFYFAGAFRNRKLGSYHTFATDPKLAVILRFETRVIVVTPENPQYFVARIKELRNLQGP